MTDYLQRVITARVYDVAQESPLQIAVQLSRRIENRLLLKREDLQSVYSFKLRGAYNKMVGLSAAALGRGVICASAGNHAQGVALAARMLKASATIVMPVTTPQVKVTAVKARGGRVVLHGDNYDEAYAKARELAKRRHLTFVHPFDDPAVIAGQGTIGMEILRQCHDPIDVIFLPIGGGGLAAGVAAYVKQVSPRTRIVGVEPFDSDAMYQSLRAGRRVKLARVGLFADGVAVKQVGRETFRLCRRYLYEVVRVDTDEICAAIKDVFQDTRAILEPSGALAIAGAKRYAEQRRLRGATLVAVASGANLNFDRLRFVAERAEVGENREGIFAVTIPEERGSLKRLCALLGERNVTEFNYRISDSASAHVFLGVQTKGKLEGPKLVRQLTRSGFETIDLTGDEMAKSHIRHLVGGRSPLARREILLRFEFPERTGALMKFLEAMSSNWNISLFHYRNHGGDYGRVLIGLQAPAAEMKAFRAFLKSTGYPFWDETKNRAYRLFLR